MTVSMAGRCLIISAFLSVILAQPLKADTPVVAKAIIVEGAVTIFLAKEKFGRRVTVGTSFAEGDRIVTGKNSAVVIEFDNGIRIRIDESSEMIVRVN